MLNGVITRPLSVLDEVLNELEGLRPLEASRLEAEWSVQRAVERDLQLLSEIVQMRNVIVHRYDQVEQSILTTVVNDQLDEYRAFRQDILSFIASQDETDE